MSKSQTTNKRTKFRAHGWLNIVTMKPIYSIQARAGKNGWAHLHEDGKPMFFDIESDRDAKLKELTCAD